MKHKQICTFLLADDGASHLLQTAAAAPGATARRLKSNIPSAEPKMQEAQK